MYLARELTVGASETFNLLHESARPDAWGELAFLHRRSGSVAREDSAASRYRHIKPSL
jgi:hypothetical protein